MKWALPATLLLATAGAGILQQATFRATGTGASDRSAMAKLRDVVSVKDFGAVGDGSTDNVTAFTAIAAVANATTGMVIDFPDGTYKYTGGLVFTKPVVLRGAQAAILNYTGTGKAVQFGPTNLTSTSDAHYSPYEIHGLTFTGGSAMTHGVYISPWITNVIIDGTAFIDFGASTVWNVFAQRQNWLVRIRNVTMSQTLSFARQWNGIRVQGEADDGTSADSGNSRLVLTNSIISPFGSQQGATGVYVSGTHSLISHTTFQNFLTAAVQVGAYAIGTTVEFSYLEQYNTSAPIILYGDSAGARTSTFTDGLTVRDSYFNVHNIDLASTVHVVGPATASGGLKNANVSGNKFNQMTAAQAVVVLNNAAGQTGNRAWDNLWTAGSGFSPMSTTGGPILHTAGASITVWSGGDEILSAPKGLIISGTQQGSSTATLSVQNLTNNQNLVTLKAGSSTQQYNTIQLLDYADAVLGVFECSGSGLDNACNFKGPGGNTGLQIDSNGKTVIFKGVLGDGAGMKHKRAVGGCATGASIGAVCSTTFSWGTAFADANYTVACTGNAITSGAPILQGITAKVAASITVQTLALTAAAAQFTNIECIATHD